MCPEGILEIYPVPGHDPLPEGVRVRPGAEKEQEGISCVLSPDLLPTRNHGGNTARISVSPRAVRVSVTGQRPVYGVIREGALSCPSQVRRSGEPM